MIAQMVGVPSIITVCLLLCSVLITVGVYIGKVNEHTLRIKENAAEVKERIRQNEMSIKDHEKNNSVMWRAINQQALDIRYIKTVIKLRLDPKGMVAEPIIGANLNPDKDEEDSDH